MPQLIRRNFPLLVISILLFASCTPQPVSVAKPTNAPSPTVLPVTHAPEIRFALIGEPRDENVWKLFDESGASYADYALRSEYWPRLYHLAPPEFNFEPLAANGMPSPVTPEGEFYSATVKLRTDLKWTDGTSFTANDVAFTVNSALAFELGYDWNAYYSRDYLESVEVIDTSTVKFIFKQQPNVSVWQYGALQGPIVQKAYWEPRINEAAGLLPDAALRAQVDEARTYFAKAQSTVKNLTAQVTLLRLNGQSDRKLEGNLTGARGELTFAQNSLNKLLEGYTTKIESAREALYVVDNKDEPTLGTWIPAERKGNDWVNEANPDFPFIKPNFDRAVYSFYSNAQDAETALKENQVDAILRPDDNTPPESNSLELMSSPNGNLRFLIFNPANSALADSTLRQALACIIWLPTRPLSMSVSGFVLAGDDSWRNSDAATPCADITDQNMDLRLARAVQLLKSAGYTWNTEPTKDTRGSGLNTPDARSFPAIKVLSLGEDGNSLEALDAKMIADQADNLGIPLNVEQVNPEDIRYEVLSSKKYDMAILGWSLSLYPGYLCQWFGGQGQFYYGSDRLKSECEALEVDSDLDSARQHVFEIQSILAKDLPFIPLYAGVTYDAYRNIHYPFESVSGGLVGLYGSPSYAMP